MRQAALFLSALLFMGALTARAQDLAGVYATAPITLTLQRAGQAWIGVLEVAEESFALEELTEAGHGVLIGWYRLEGERFGVHLARQGQGLVMAAEGMEIFLARIGYAPPAGVQPPSAPPEGAGSVTGPAPPAPSAQPAPTAGRDEIVDARLGVRFTPPDGWLARHVEEQNLYLLGSNTMIGVMLVLPTAATGVDVLYSEMSQGLHEDGASLSLVGTLEKFGTDGLAGDFEGTVQGQRARAHAVGRVGPQGGATVLMTTTSDGHTPEHKAAARALASSMAFFAPDTGPLIREWDDRLRGMVLSKYDRYSSGSSTGVGGYTSRETIDLCAAGHYFQSDTFQMSIDTGGAFGSSASQGGGAGTWEVAVVAGQLVLRLRSSDGAVRDLPLGWGNVLPSSSSSRYTRVGGVDFLRTRSERQGC
jgi:hypothetical protein